MAKLVIGLICKLIFIIILQAHHLNTIFTDDRAHVYGERGNVLEIFKGA